MNFLQKHINVFISQYKNLVNGEIASEPLYILNIYICNFSGTILFIECCKYIDKGTKININKKK